MAVPDLLPNHLCGLHSNLSRLVLRLWLRRLAALLLLLDLQQERAVDVW